MCTFSHKKKKKKVQLKQVICVKFTSNKIVFRISEKLSENFVELNIVIVWTWSDKPEPTFKEQTYFKTKIIKYDKISFLGTDSLEKCTR